MRETEKAIEKLNTSKIILCNPQMLTSEIRIRIGQVITDAIALLKEQQEQIDKLIEESASNAEMAEGMKELLKEQEAVVRCKDCAYALFKEEVVQHGHIVCTKPFTEHWQAVKPDNWFCADGERKETNCSEYSNGSQEGR